MNKQPVLCCAALLVMAASLMTQDVTGQQRSNDFPRQSPNATVSQTIGVTEVTIHYSRPSVRGREIFGALVPYDQVWRTGANEATAITFSSDVVLEDQPVSAGTYGLFTLPGRNNWSIILNRVPGQWGAYTYNDKQDVLRVQVKPETAPATEMLTIGFENVTDTSGIGVISWADVRVPFRIQAATDAIVLGRAANAVQSAQNWQLPFQYASYALRRNVRTDEALKWIDRSISLEENYYNLGTRARLLAAKGDFKQAAEAGEQALAKAKGMDEAPQDLAQFEQIISEWKSK